MKKILLAFALSVSFVLAACGGEETADNTAAEGGTAEVVQEGGLQDGAYRIEDQNFGETGWKEALEITVTGGEITETNWESVNEAGENKIEDENYQKTMTETDGVGPQDFIPALERSLVEKQNPAEVEAVSGATGTSEKFQDYAQQLVDAATLGETETIEVDNSSE